LLKLEEKYEVNVGDEENPDIITVEIVEAIPYKDRKGFNCLLVAYRIHDKGKVLPSGSIPAHFSMRIYENVKLKIKAVVDEYLKIRGRV